MDFQAKKAEREDNDRKTKETYQKFIQDVRPVTETELMSKQLEEMFETYQNLD